MISVTLFLLELSLILSITICHFNNRKKYDKISIFFSIIFIDYYMLKSPTEIIYAPSSTRVEIKVLLVYRSERQLDRGNKSKTNMQMPKKWLASSFLDIDLSESCFP